MIQDNRNATSSFGRPRKNRPENHHRSTTCSHHQHSILEPMKPCDNILSDVQNADYGAIETYNHSRCKVLCSDGEESAGLLTRSAALELDTGNSKYQEDAMNRTINSRDGISRQQKYWIVLSFLCFFFFAMSGLLQQHGGQIGTYTGLADLFIFDALFGSGIKKTPSAISLQQPPPTARSVLLVLRAEVTPPNPVVNDMDRQLTARGMRNAEGLGVYLQQHGIPEPDWIFSSPSERTAFTTELMRRHWASNRPVAFEDILYTLEFNDYFSFVAGLNNQFHRVMIVGHNPAILNTAKKLMRTHGIEDFPDCGFMEIRWDNLYDWSTVRQYSGSTKMAIDPNNNFFLTSPK